MSDDVSIPNASYTARRSGHYGRGRGGGLTTDNRRLLIYAGGLGGLLVVMVTASTLTSRHSGPVPVVEADPRPLRVKPDNPGGLKIDAAESDVFSGGGNTDNARLAPPAEAPNPNGLQMQKAKPAPVQPPIAAAPAPNKPSAVAAAEPPPAAAVKPATAPAKPSVVAKDSAAAKPPAAAKDAPATPAKPAVVASASPAQPAANHSAAVQLAALSTEAAAHEEWQRLQKQMPDMFGGKQPAIVKAERDGKAFWRLRTAGFADVGQARSFCEKVRAKSGSCSVADF